MRNSRCAVAVAEIETVKFCAPVVFCWLTFAVAAAPPDGNSQILAKAGDSGIVITTTARLAGAIDSLKWRGKEFIDSTDHGRQLQSACSFDNTPTTGTETFNPTEAGSRDDGAGTNTTSRLLKISAGQNHLRTTTQMAFWLAPGELSEGQLARNTNLLSKYILTKDVTIGFGRWPQALDYRVTFSVPQEGHRTNAQFEALTGYMPAEFNTFYKFDPQTKKLQPLDYGPGEIESSVVLATKDGQFAMGIFSPDVIGGISGPSYGRWFFDWAHVAKWNCVFRISNTNGIRDEFNFHMLVPIGTVTEVEDMLRDWTTAKKTAR